MRAVTAAQQAALEAKDRTTRTVVEIEDPDGSMVDVTDLMGENWLEDVDIAVTTEPPISTARIRLWKTIGALSLAPLIEGSELNRDALGAYAPFANPNRAVVVKTMTKLAGETVEDAELVELWEGIAGPIEWGSAGPLVTIDARDPMTRLNRTFIETTSEYGADDDSEDVEDVAQEILDDNFGVGVIPLTSAATAFPIKAYDLGNVTVLEALAALRDQVGWNLHWRWDASAGDFRLTLWEPDRTNTTAAWTFGQGDYYAVPRVGLDDDGVRNKWEVVYLDTNGAQQTEVDSDAASVAIYETRFGRIDARGTSVVTQAQAQALIEFALSDTANPLLLQTVDLPFFWPIELGDLYAFSPNREYDTEQKAAVFAFRHLLSRDRRRTIVELSGKPSGGYARWHTLEGQFAGEIGLAEYDTTVRNHTGTLTETTKWSRVIPANRLGLKGAVRLRFRMSPTGTAADKQIRFKLGATTYLQYDITAALTGRFEFEIVITNSGAANAQEIDWHISRESGNPSISQTTTAVDTSVAVTAALTVTLLNTGDEIDLELSSVEYLARAA